MNIDQRSILIGGAAFIVGALASGAVATYAVNGNHTGVMDMYAMHNNTMSDTDSSSMSMDGMVTSLKGKTGDTFDKAFMSEMIVHHQGAIDMANLALANAKHQEVKALARGIVTAQTTEIQQMKDWQTQWGYTSSSITGDHDMMGM